MKHFINLKDIPSKDLRKILLDAKKRKKKKEINLMHCNLIKTYHLKINY